MSRKVGCILSLVVAVAVPTAFGLVAFVVVLLGRSALPTVVAGFDADLADQSGVDVQRNATLELERLDYDLVLRITSLNQLNRISLQSRSNDQIARDLLSNTTITSPKGADELFHVIIVVRNRDAALASRFADLLMEDKIARAQAIGSLMYIRNAAVALNQGDQYESAANRLYQQYWRCQAEYQRTGDRRFLEEAHGIEQSMNDLASEQDASKLERLRAVFGVFQDPIKFKHAAQRCHGINPADASIATAYGVATTGFCAIPAIVPLLFLWLIRKSKNKASESSRRVSSHG